MGPLGTRRTFLILVALVGAASKPITQADIAAHMDSTCCVNFANQGFTGTIPTEMG